MWKFDDKKSPSTTTTKKQPPPPGLFRSFSTSNTSNNNNNNNTNAKKKKQQQKQQQQAPPIDLFRSFRNNKKEEQIDYTQTFWTMPEIETPKETKEIPAVTKKGLPQASSSSLLSVSSAPPPPPPATMTQKVTKRLSKKQQNVSTNPFDDDDDDDDDDDEIPTSSATATTAASTKVTTTKKTSANQKASTNPFHDAKVTTTKKTTVKQKVSTNPFENDEKGLSPPAAQTKANRPVKITTTTTKIPISKLTATATTTNNNSNKIKTTATTVTKTMVNKPTTNNNNNNNNNTPKKATITNNNNNNNTQSPAIIIDPNHELFQAEHEAQQQAEQNLILQSQQNQAKRDEEYKRVQNQLSETVQTSHATCELLSSQKEQLQHTATLVEHTGDVVNQSRRLLRGMTWSGWIANKFGDGVEGSSSNANSATGGDAYSLRNSTGGIPEGNAARNGGLVNQSTMTVFGSFKINNGPSLPPPKIDYDKYLSKDPSANPNPFNSQTLSLILTAISHAYNYRQHIMNVFPTCTTLLEIQTCSDACSSLKKEIFNVLHQYQAMLSQIAKTENLQSLARKERRQKEQEKRFEKILYGKLMKEVNSLEETQTKFERNLKYRMGIGRKSKSMSRLEELSVSSKSMRNLANSLKEGANEDNDDEEEEEEEEGEEGDAQTVASRNTITTSITTTTMNSTVSGLTAVTGLQSKSTTLQQTPQAQAQSKRPTKQTLQRQELFGPKPRTSSKPTKTLEQVQNEQFQKQDEHLSILSQGLNELQNVNTTMNFSIREQNELLDQISEDADLYRHDMKVLVRKADRMTSKMSWSGSVRKPFFQYNISLKHVPTGKYLTTATTTTNSNKGVLYLSAKLHPFGSVFELHKKGKEAPKKAPTTSMKSSRNLTEASATSTHEYGGAGAIVGLKNKRNGKWMGLSFWGGPNNRKIVCVADNFGKREEWELEEGEGLKKKEDDDSEDNKQPDLSVIVTLINASANWGNGGYLETKPGREDVYGDCDVGLSIGVPEVIGKKTAALWVIEKRDDTVNQSMNQSVNEPDE